MFNRSSICVNSSYAFARFTNSMCISYESPIRSPEFKNAPNAPSRFNAPLHVQSRHKRRVDGSPDPHFNASSSFTNSRLCISQKIHPSFNGSLLVSIFNTTNALFRFKAPLHIVMHKHELMDHRILNLNMSMYGAYHNLDGFLGIYAYITHLDTYKHGNLMDDHTLSLNLWM